MGIEEYYNSVQEEILLKRKQIRNFIKTPKLLGDYYEEIIKDYLKDHLPSRLKISGGVVTNIPKTHTSRECDIMIYDSTNWFPLFKTGGLAVIPSTCVKAVVEVKSDVTSNTLKDAKRNFRSVHKIESSIQCFLIGFVTGRNLGRLIEELGEEGEIFVFSNRNGNLIPNQLRFFMESLEHPGVPVR